ncbi:MAG: hypothetical protein JWR36_665 [Glaciihabitans sp.]|jgi:hypothetical protein|nr:hypothetical protein [Glaciihabitans sp.]MDQ1569910.1 hypothetical protein [Actinomycetota bacterium]
MVQLRPRGSASAIERGVAVTEAAPGIVIAAALMVAEIEAMRAEPIERGVAVSDITLLGAGGGGKFISGPVRCS